jgi:hypothetical protein
MRLTISLLWTAMVAACQRRHCPGTFRTLALGMEDGLGSHRAQQWRGLTRFLPNANR